VLEGAHGAHRDIAVFNAAGALVVAERARDLADGVRIAEHALDIGAARETLDRLVTVSNA
jgi:anthranilate phosphoribosyltransferase